MIASGLEIGKDFTAVDVAQPDSMDFCKCQECMKAVAKERANSAPVLYFTNIIGGRHGRALPRALGIDARLLGRPDPPDKEPCRGTT